MRRNQDYDFIFVLSGVPIAIPSGGLRIIFALAQGLSLQGYKTALFYRCGGKSIRDIDVSGNRLLRQVKKLLFRINDTRFGYFTINPILRATQSLSGKWEPENVDIIFGRYLHDRIHPRYLIATNFLNAFYVSDYSSHETHKYFLIQIDERNPEYSGIYSGRAVEAYDLPIQKIVINRVYERIFSNEHPLFFQIGIRDEFIGSHSSVENKDPTSVAIPLRTSQQKGATYALDALGHIHKRIPQCRLIAFGDIEKKHVPDFIEYHYKPSDQFMKEIYTQAAIFVLPSIFEGMPAPPLEAMASGCAVVSTDNVGINEYLIQGQNGIIVPIRDSLSLADAVCKLIRDPQDRIRLARAGMKTARDFSYSQMVHKFINAILGP